MTSPRTRPLRSSAAALIALVAVACQEPTEPARLPADMEAAPERQDLAGLLDRAHWADGYLWANDPTSAVYTPMANWAFNRTGGAIQITKPAGTTGRYVARFNGLSDFLGNKSTVHVTGYQDNDTYCKPVTANVVSNAVEVRCFKASTGAAINGLFSVLVTRNYTDVAFAHAHQPAATDYAPLGAASWNPTGAMRVFRSGPGSYQVRFTGLATQTSANGGHVQVNSVGTGKHHCKVISWNGNPDIVVNVQCYTQAGLPGDSKFNVLFLFPSDRLAYAWANSPTSPSYVPSGLYSTNPIGAPINITRGGIGFYNVTWSGIDPVILGGGDVQVTAYGTGNAQCKVISWGTSNALVRCFAPNGAPVDALFTVLMGS